jgi:opacity protein-like surface antigen
MRILKLTTVALALASAFPNQAAEPAAAGMTAEQVAEFNRIKVKTEALEDTQESSGFKGLKFSGYMDPTYVYNFNKQRGTFQFVVPISKEPYAYDNGYFGTLALDVQKETDNGTKFHLTLYPKRGGGDVMGENSIVHEASVWIPLGSLSTKLFAGQLPDWSGYEYYAPNIYKNITHNLLFDYTLPASYTGIGLELVRGKLDLKLMLANMNASVRNIGEHIPMFVFRGDHAVGEYWGWGFAGAAGYKTNFRATGANPVSLVDYSTKDSLYTTLEVDYWYTRADVTLNAHVTYGQQQKAAIAPNADTGNLQAAQWAAASVLAAYKFTQRVEGVLRADFVYNQKNGGGLLDYTVPDAVSGIGPANGGAFIDDPANPGTLIPDYANAAWQKGANRYAITAGLNYALNSNVLIKGEYRYDGATQAVFGNKDLLTGTGANPKYLKSNSLLATSVVFSF